MTKLDFKLTIIIAVIFLSLKTLLKMSIFSYYHSVSNPLGSLGSVAGSVIQATGRTDFEDGPRIGNQSEVGNSLQRVRTIPENN